MATVIYNTETQKQETKFLPNGYIVDGKPGKLNPNQVELAVVYGIEPEIGTNSDGIKTGYTTFNWVVDLESEEYRKEYTVNGYSQEEIEDKALENYKSSINWALFEDRLQTTFLPSTTGTTTVSGETVVTGETFLERSLTCSIPAYESLLRDCILGKWYKIIESAFIGVKNNLPVGLTAADLDELNGIISEANFNFQLE